MNARQYIGIVASVSLVIYLFALWSEAAYEPGHIGFNESLTWPRMIEAYGLTTMGHVVQLEVIPMGIVAVAGMVAALVAAFIPGRLFPTWAIASYAGILLICGGWIGVIGLVFVPFDTLDGEFLADGLARITASGFWTALVLAFLGHRILKRERITEPSAGPYGSPAAGSPPGQP